MALLTIDMVTKEAMMVAHEVASFIGCVDRSYDDSFAKTGAKGGSTLRVREPNVYTRRQGSRVMDVQDQNESSQTITLATQDGVDMRFNGADLALSIDEFSDRYIRPAVSGLVSAIDADCIATATKDTYNLVGTPGTAVGTVTSGFSDTTALGLARAKLNQGLAPKDANRCLHLDSVSMASVANGIKGLFHPDTQVKEAFREGFIAKSAMATFYENERTYTHTVGSDVTGTTDAANAAVTDGGSSITYDSTASLTLNVGDIFTVAGVYACHPETKQAYSHHQQFTVVALPGSRVITVSPSTVLTGAKKNVVSATSGTLATTDFNNKTMTFVGTASMAYRQNLMFHKDAFAFVTADLPIMADASRCVRMTKDGLSLRVWEGSDIRNDERLLRIDILYGFKTLRPAWACRITN